MGSEDLPYTARAAIDARGGLERGKVNAIMDGGLAKFEITGYHGSEYNIDRLVISISCVKTTTIEHKWNLLKDTEYKKTTTSTRTYPVEWANPDCAVEKGKPFATYVRIMPCSLRESIEWNFTELTGYKGKAKWRK